MKSLLSHCYIFSAIAFGTYSQLIMRWQVHKAGALPESLIGKVNFIFHLFLNPWVVSAIVSTLFGGVAWMLAMTKFEISYAYPWMTLGFVLVLFFGVTLFGETLGAAKIIGTLLILSGIIALSRG